MHEQLQKLLEDLQELSDNCGDSRGRNGLRLYDQIYPLTGRVSMLMAEARRVDDGLTRIEKLMRDTMNRS